MIACLLLSGCGEASGSGVARVGDQVISAEQVAYVAGRDGVDVEQALETCIEDALLLAEAERRGIRVSDYVQRQAAVQVLLGSIESRHATEAITLQQIRAEYDATVARVGPDAAPPFNESIEPIQTLLAGRARMEALTTLLEGLPEPLLLDARWDELLRLPRFESDGP